MHNPCLLESVILPEAPTAFTSPPDSFRTVPTEGRFQETPLDGLVWDPDSVPHGRHITEEGLQLEKRGVTSPTRPQRARGPTAAPQSEFWTAQCAHKNAIAAKLREFGRTDEAAALELCHTYFTICQCDGCHRVRKFPNRCDRFYCPQCQPALSHERRNQVEWWTKSINQPKHVVLTVANTSDLTAGHIDQLRRWFTALRRRKIARFWKGGFYTIECTNEGRGWHLHIHALVDARWIDAPQLAQAWSSVTGEIGHIVKVRDCRDAEYLAEVTKYAVKGSQLAKWPADQVSTFIDAFQGKRTFGVFGSLYAVRTEFAEWIAMLKQGHRTCECGCDRQTYYSEAEWLIKELSSQSPTCTRPPPPKPETTLLIPPDFCWPD